MYKSALCLPWIHQGLDAPLLISKRCGFLRVTLFWHLNAIASDWRGTMSRSLLETAREKHLKCISYQFGLSFFSPKYNCSHELKHSLQDHRFFFLFHQPIFKCKNVASYVKHANVNFIIVFGCLFRVYRHSRYFFHLYGVVTIASEGC